MKIKVLFLVIAFLVSGFAGVSSAADPAKQTLGKKEGRWLNIFPIGTEIHSFAIDPQDNRFYASTYKGLFRSVDGGNLWLPLFYSLRLGELKSSIIKIDPSSPKTLYWAWKIKDRRETGLFRSKDGGVSWDDISAGVIKDGIYDIALHPKIPEIIYVASEGGLYKTLNGGKTWGKIANSTYSVFLNPERPDEIYTCLGCVKKGQFSFQDRNVIGLHRSTDGGQNFELVERQPEYTDFIHKYMDRRLEEKECEEVYNPILNPHNTKEIFIKCWNMHFVKSSDGGNSWLDISPKEFTGTETDLFGKKFDNYVKLQVSAVEFHPKEKDTIYVTTLGRGKNPKVGMYGNEPDKVLKSMDGGKTWTPLSIPPQQNIRDITIPFPNTIYIATDYGVYKTTDDCKTWEPRSFGLPTRMERKGLMWVDTQTDSIYVGDNSGGFNEPMGYWLSSDKGISWKWNSGPKEQFGWSGVNQIVTTLDLTTYWLVNSGEKRGVYKITSEGNITQIKIDNVPKYLSISPSNSQILYVVYAGGVILKSEDGGFSWSQIDWQRWLQMEQGHINLLSVDPRSPDILYGVVKHTQHFSFIKTTDGGKTWTDVSRGLYDSIASAWSSSKWLNPKERLHMANLLLSSPTSVVIDPSNSNIVYITTSAGGVYRSDDGGKTWKSKSPINYLKTLINTFDNYSAQQCKGRKNCKVTLDVALSGGIIRYAPQDTVIVYPKKVLDEVGLNFNNIAIAPSNPKTIYLATGIGVYISSDRGDSWQLVNNGLLDTAVKRVMASSSLVIAEGENGIYSLSGVVPFEKRVLNGGLDKPKTPYEDQGACPFECSTYRTWVAKRDIVIRKDMNEKSPVVFKVRKGEKVTGITGVVVTTTPGVAKVIKATNIDGEQANVGDTVYVLTYSGEGVYKIWYKGKTVVDMDIMGDIEIINTPKSIWWVKIKNNKGQIGWTSQSEDFGNQDACG